MITLNLIYPFLISGTLFQTGLRCKDCGYSCHEKCCDNVPKTCTKYKSVSDGGHFTSQTLTRSGGDTASVNSSKFGVFFW